MSEEMVERGNGGMGEGRWKRYGEEARREGARRKGNRRGGRGVGGREKEELCDGGREIRKDKEFCRVDMQRKTLP